MDADSPKQSAAAVPGVAEAGAEADLELDELASISAHTAFVVNLPYSVTANQIRPAFEP